MADLSLGDDTTPARDTYSRTRVLDPILRGRRHIMRFTTSCVLAIAIALAAAACSSDSTTSATTTSPSPATTSDAFSGSLTQLGTTSLPFVVGATGTVSITLTAVAPLSTMALGVGVGTWDGTTCSAAISKNDNARTSVTALTGTATAGNYCVSVYDSGNVPEGWTVTFTVQVVHS